MKMDNLKVLTYCLSLYLFVNLITPTTGVFLFCTHPNEILKKYNNETHLCQDGRVIPRHVTAPKTPPPTTQPPPLVPHQDPVTAAPAPAPALLTSRLEHDRHTAAPSPTTAAPVPTPTPKLSNPKYSVQQLRTPIPPQVSTTATHVLVTPRPQTSWYHGPCEDGRRDELHCGGVVLCGRKFGWECCGRERYRPARQTCCQAMEYEWKIFQKPEKSNVCCRSNVGYTLHPRRQGEIPCLHPGLNDPIWRPLSVKSLDNEYKLCPSLAFRYAYLLTFKGTTSDGSSYKVTFKQIQFNNDYNNISKGEKLSKTMPIDRDSPRKRLTGRSILILSHVDKANDLDFHLHTGDVIVKVRRRTKKSKKNMKKTFRKVLKLMRNC